MPERGMSFEQRLGTNVRVLRGHRGLTQRELAADAGLHRSEVGMLERGLRTPRADTVFRLAGALGVPVEKLFVGICWAPRLSGPGEFIFPTREEWHGEVLRRAAAFRATQTKEVDAVALIREGREEMARRGRPEDDQ